MLKEGRDSSFAHKYLCTRLSSMTNTCRVARHDLLDTVVMSTGILLKAEGVTLRA